MGKGEMHQPTNAIARAEETIGKHEARIEALSRKREALLEKVKKIGTTDKKGSLMLVEQMRVIEQETSDLMTKIKNLRNQCRLAGSIETMVSEQQHMDDLNLYMVQSMSAVGLDRVRGINTASEKIAQDVKTFSMYTSLDPDKEEKEEEESQRYLDEILAGLGEPSSTTQSATTQQKQPQKGTLSNLDDLMAMLK